MKPGIFLIAVIICWSCSDELNADKVPSVVQNAVSVKFPQAIDIDWKKIIDGYEAEFNMNKIEYTVHIDPGGKLILYKYDIKADELPVAIAVRISTEYSGYKIDDIEKIEKDTLTYYQAELDGKGKKDLELVFLADGSLAKQLKYLN